MHIPDQKKKKPNMTRSILALFLAGSLVACDAQAPAATSPAPVAQAPAAATAKACPPASAFSYTPLPADIGLAVPVHLRQDRINAAPDGSLRRVVVFEYLEGDQRSTMDSLATSLASAGYAAGAERTRSDGRIEAKFRKGKQQIVVSVASVVGNKPSHPSARGTFGINMPYAQPERQAVARAQ